MKHAIIKIADMDIPLIGVAESAVLEECDLCHDIYGIQDIILTGKQFLCKVCANEV